ncbi:hypothetical protein BVG79_01055 [Ketogulonicigenium robustum]|uniref:Ead/Ea22-like family protein n=1 Tax=Ketogulonicigenium robustum TaxID=92947 RepID=A0A1W6NZ07_9RHOB|nr:hypothetical protein [Ketogulonicigenium robustum]ARO14401.1 hypothetical protein BVG79_01055 [Ketogulonicigenium robustum]
MTIPNLTPEHLQSLLDGATEGPWRLHDCESYDGRTTTHYQEVWSGNLDVIVAEVFRANNDGGRGNMRLIALAPDLARRVIELEADAARIRAELAGERANADAMAAALSDCGTYFGGHSGVGVRVDSALAAHTNLREGVK